MELADEKYYIYASDAGKTPSESILVLNRGAPIDQFVSSLKNKVIILKNKPTSNVLTAYDDSDEWLKWMDNIGYRVQSSLMFVPGAATDQTLQSFQFSFTAPWGELTFSSSSEALESAFGKEAASTIEPPGVVSQENALLYCGLVAPLSDLKLKIEDLFTYVGLDEMLENLPTILPKLAVTLGPSNYKSHRNFMWCNPLVSYRTIVRLQFKLDDADALKKLLEDKLPAFNIVEADVICKKILTECETVDGPVAVDQGCISFEAVSIISLEGREVQMTTGIDFRESGIILTFKTGKNALQDILHWLGQAIQTDLTPDINMFGPPNDTKFNGIKPQRVVIGLNTALDPDKPKLAYFRVEIEVAGNFGLVDGKQPVFLLTYVWTNKTGSLGSIRGELWTDYNISAERRLEPDYEMWSDLSPYTENPGTAIDLETLIPGQRVEIPEVIPSQISRAFAVLSKDSVSFGATINAKEDISPGQAPQPYLDQVSLDVSYSWGNTNQFKFEFGVAAGIEPIEGSVHDEPAVLTGNLRYSRNQGNAG